MFCAGGQIAVEYAKLMAQQPDDHKNYRVRCDLAMNVYLY